jgi:hypothetical protein
VQAPTDQKVGGSNPSKRALRARKKNPRSASWMTWGFACLGPDFANALANSAPGLPPHGPVRRPRAAASGLSRRTRLRCRPGRAR